MPDQWKESIIITTAFQLALECHYEGPGKPGGAEITWDTSASGLC
jgi:hypothetical protein